MTTPEQDTPLTLPEALLIIAERTQYQTSTEQDQVLDVIRAHVEADRAAMAEYRSLLDGGDDVTDQSIGG